MTEIADTPVPGPVVAATAESPAVPAPSKRNVPTVHEAYSFACMKCGYGWEQAYEIEHHVDGEGRPSSSTRSRPNGSRPRSRIRRA